MAKRKRIDGPSPNDRRMGERNGGVTPSKTLTQFDPSKRPKTGIFFQRDSAIVRVRADLRSIDSLLSLQERSIHCIVHGCGNWARSDWVYCSPACIRRHITDTLQAIQRSKGGVRKLPFYPLSVIPLSRTTTIHPCAKIFFSTRIERRKCSIEN